MSNKISNALLEQVKVINIKNEIIKLKTENRSIGQRIKHLWERENKYSSTIFNNVTDKEVCKEYNKKIDANYNLLCLLFKLQESNSKKILDYRNKLKNTSTTKHEKKLKFVAVKKLDTDNASEGNFVLSKTLDSESGKLLLNYINNVYKSNVEYTIGNIVATIFSSTISSIMANIQMEFFNNSSIESPFGVIRDSHYHEKLGKLFGILREIQCWNFHKYDVYLAEVVE